MKLGTREALLGTFLTSLLLFVRIEWTQRLDYAFLIWNLILAWLPWGLSVIMSRVGKRLPNAVWLPLVLVWLLLFPNGPYIVTDFIHLVPRHLSPLWLDATMLGAASWTGCVLGFWSLRLVHDQCSERFGERVGWAMAWGSLALASLGIYLGRVLRWNSWDIVNRPKDIVRDGLELLLQPQEHALDLFGLIAGTVLLVVGYAAFRGRLPALRRSPAAGWLLHASEEASQRKRERDLGRREGALSNCLRGLELGQLQARLAGQLDELAGAGQPEAQQLRPVALGLEHQVGRLGTGEHHGRLAALEFLGRALHQRRQRRLDADPTPEVLRGGQADLQGGVEAGPAVGERLGLGAVAG
jgi:uncharacterized membrane protein